MIVTKQANDGIKTTRPRLNVTTTTTGERTGRVNGLEYNASGTSSRLPRSTEIPRARRSTANPREPPGSVRRGNGPFGPCVCVAGRKTTSPGIVKAPSGRKTKKVGRGVSRGSSPRDSVRYRIRTEWFDRLRFRDNLIGKTQHGTRQFQENRTWDEKMARSVNECGTGRLAWSRAAWVVYGGAWAFPKPTDSVRDHGKS